MDSEKTYLVAHFICVLQSQVAETAETLYGDGFTARNLHLSHRIEDGDASAEKRRVACGINLCGDVDGGFGAKDAIFGDYNLNQQYEPFRDSAKRTSTIASYAVDLLVHASLVEAPLALLAGSCRGQSGQMLM